MSPRQKVFAAEYLKDRNATQAAIRAGYTKKGASMTGCALLKKPEIKKYIEKQLELQVNRIKLSADAVLEELRRIAFSNLTDFFDEKGKVDMAAMKELPRDLTAALQAYEEEKRKAATTRKIKLHNKVSALEALARHFGLFETDNRQKATIRVGFDNETDEDE